MTLDIAFFTFSCILICLSCCSAIPFVAAFTSSMLNFTPSSVLMYSKPASSPGPPKISAIAVPTCDELAGNSFSFAATCCMTSNVVMLPSCKAFCTPSADMPIPLRASAVAFVISRIRRLPSLITSTPLSEKTPCFAAFVEIATKSSADNPASLKYRGYSFIVSRNSPFAFAPLTNPSRINEIASSILMPKPFDIALADCMTSLKSMPK